METGARPGTDATGLIAAERDAVAHTYHPLPVVVATAEGAWVEDVEGHRYLDCLAAYSAVNFGHRHPALLDAATEQLGRVTLTSRAFHTDQLGPFATELAALVGKEAVLPMNTGAEAVESAIKLARKWGYERREVPDGQARIIVAADNFHGRTTTIVGFSTDPAARHHFGPFAPGFDVVPYDDLAAIEAALRPETVAVLIEPIQGEAGVHIPAPGFLAGVRELCDRAGILFVADEIQSGLGRTGQTLACHNEDVEADVYILGKALGGGIVPVSAVVADWPTMSVLHPGEHGSTFGGNPLAAAVGRAVVRLLRTGEPQAHARALEPVLDEGLRSLHGRGVAAHRVRGLWAGVDIDPGLATGRQVCQQLAELGVLAKDTHGSTLRLAPPLVLTEEELRWAIDQLGEALRRVAATTA